VKEGKAMITDHHRAMFFPTAKPDGYYKFVQCELYLVTEEVLGRYPDIARCIPKDSPNVLENVKVPAIQAKEQTPVGVPGLPIDIGEENHPAWKKRDNWELGYRDALPSVDVRYLPPATMAYKLSYSGNAYPVRFDVIDDNGAEWVYVCMPISNV
jgi:hypothetical protein